MGVTARCLGVQNYSMQIDITSRGGSAVSASYQRVFSCRLHVGIINNTSFFIVIHTARTLRQTRSTQIQGKVIPTSIYHKNHHLGRLFQYEHLTYFAGVLRLDDQTLFVQHVKCVCHPKCFTVWPRHKTVLSKHFCLSSKQYF